MSFSYRKTPEGRVVPRGGGVFSIIGLVLTAVLTGGIGVAAFAVIDANSCTINVFFGCDPSGGGRSGGSGGSTHSTTPPSLLTTPPATPAIGSGDFTANPTTVDTGGSSTLTWKNVSNATDCTITSDTGFSYSGGASGSTQVANITQTGVYTLTCENGAGGPSTSSSLKIIVSPHYKEL